MNDYIILISIGPVQSFISAARRSRDLWSGSWMLSELAKACAASLKEGQCNLIFPDDQGDLAPGSALNVGNKVQAVVHNVSAAAVRALVQTAKQATQARFTELAEEARQQLGNAPLRTHIWQAQIDDYLEIQAAWLPYTAETYKTCSEQANLALSARKATRDFKPSPLAFSNPDYMVPKCSLDGARETVLHESESRNPNQPPSSVRQRLRLADSEQLDCAGLTKRFGAESVAEQFTPLSRVTADAWLTLIKEDAPETLAALRKAYEPLIALDLATRVTGNDGIYRDFPFDAQLCYPYRLGKMRQDSSFNSQKTQVLDQLHEALKPVWKKYGVPVSYGVLLLADGDNMGKLLDQARGLKDHQAITQALSRFAESVAKVLQARRGHAIYAGGDDVLAFVPLHEAILCADQLRHRFSEVLAPIANMLGVHTPTLSVGLGIAHIMTPLGQIRDLAKEAEGIAKGNGLDEALRRNALGIKLSVRGGADTSLRMRWDNAADWEFMNQAVAGYLDKKKPGQTAAKLSSRIAYDLRAIGEMTRFALTKPNEVDNSIQQAEVKRLFDKARNRQGEKLAPQHIELIHDRLKQKPMLDVANELIIARWLAAKLQGELGDNGE